MAAEDISSTATMIDALPNIGMSAKVITVACTENDDWVDMSIWGFTTVHMAFALVTNALEVCTISDSTKVVFGAGGSDNIKLLVIGV